MSQWYDGEQIRDQSENPCDESDYAARKRLVVVSDETFHHTSCDMPVDKLECGECGGDEFNVGTASWYTAIRCTTCGWELCVHEG